MVIHKNIVLGVTGSIAAYKAPEMVRMLAEQGAKVRCVVTSAAEAFVTRETLAALSCHTVPDPKCASPGWPGMLHIDLARWADFMLIAPASADFLARLAHGMADNLLNAICLATDRPVWVAPAMNREMWLHPATQSNMTLLRARHVNVLDPAEGAQACGEEGPGRMLAPHDILQELTEALSHNAALRGLRVLITAGATREPIDPVRFISNRSSGKMGYALADAAIKAGAKVTLISGSSDLIAPPVHRLERVERAEEMHHAVFSHLASSDIFIAAAAVSDYRPCQEATMKIKKSSSNMTLHLSLTSDILKEAAEHDRAPFTVGFAAETENLIDNAKKKLHEKKLNMMIANHVGAGVGFETEDNSCDALWHGGEIHFPKEHKKILAQKLVQLIGVRYHETNRNQDS